MVNSKLTNVTSLTGEGLRDWLVQRVTSVIMGIYILFLFGFFLCYPHLDFYTWQSLFASTVMRVFSVLFLISLILHAWVGVWTIFTDYLKWVGLRLLLQVLVIIALFAYLIWGIDI